MSCLKMPGNAWDNTTLLAQFDDCAKTFPNLTLVVRRDTDCDIISYVTFTNLGSFSLILD